MRSAAAHRETEHGKERKKGERKSKSMGTRVKRENKGGRSRLRPALQAWLRTIGSPLTAPPPRRPPAPCAHRRRVVPARVAAAAALGWVRRVLPSSARGGRRRAPGRRADVRVGRAGAGSHGRGWAVAMLYLAGRAGGLCGRGRALPGCTRSLEKADSAKKLMRVFFVSFWRCYKGLRVRRAPWARFNSAG